MSIAGPTHLLCKLPAGVKVKARAPCETCGIEVIERLVHCRCKNGTEEYCTQDKCDDCSGTVIDRVPGPHGPPVGPRARRRTRVKAKPTIAGSARLQHLNQIRDRGRR